MPIQSGLDYLVEVFISGSNTLVAGQRGLTLPKTAENLDATSKDESGWTKTIGGTRAWDIELDGLLIYEDAGQDYLLTSFKNNTSLTVQITRPDGKVWKGDARITAHEEAMPYNDVATFKVTLKGEGIPAKFWETP